MCPPYQNIQQHSAGERRVRSTRYVRLQALTPQSPYLRSSVSFHRPSSPNLFVQTKRSQQNKNNIQANSSFHKHTAHPARVYSRAIGRGTANQNHEARRPLGEDRDCCIVRPWHVTLPARARIQASIHIETVAREKVRRAGRHRRHGGRASAKQDGPRCRRKAQGLPQPVG